ncbi:MAG: hypothetical protein LAQ69_31145 [Acidobacteriia bacterium]|nr:hypothetical protein [Terriglobia bacterium]
MRMQLLAVLLVSSSTALGADREFDQMVKAVEAHYGVKRTHIPLMGVANLFVKVGRPAGVSGFKLAIFENLNSAPGYGDLADLDQFFDEVSAGGLRPLVRVHSRHRGESTYICTGEIGKSTRMLIATFQRNEATIVQVNVNMDTLLKTLAAPELASETFGIHHDGDRW